MAQPSSTPAVPAPSPDQRRVAVENYERARQVLQTGNHDYAINLLTLSCKIDPAEFKFRQLLRRAQKEKYGNNMRGSRFAFLSTPRAKARVKAAKAGRDYLRVLELGEAVLTKNPWDAGTQMDMAEAFDALGLTDMAVFSLQEARQKFPQDATLNRALARILEKRGDFQKAITLWQMVQKADPKDVEAAHKAMHLAASDTIARGKYEEVASGTKNSPALGGMEAQAVGKQDKLGREAGPLEKRIEANPTEPSLYVQLADVFLKHAQDDRARAALQQGLGPTGNHFTLQLKLMELEVLPFRKNLELTDAKLKKLRDRVAADQDTDDEPSEDDLVKAREKLVKEIAAREVEVLRVRADRFPNETGHRLELGVRLLKVGKVDEAITELQQAKRDEKTKARAAMYAGLAFRKRSNWKLAQRNFEEALQLLPETDEAARKEVLFQLATGSAEAEDYARAVDLGHELANIDFGYKGIGDLLAGWEKRVQEA